MIDIQCAHCGEHALRLSEDEYLGAQVWALCVACATTYFDVAGVVSMILARPTMVNIVSRDADGSSA